MNRFPDLDAWLQWQLRLHPQSIALGLERVAAVWARLGPARLPCPLITVGGTNGKGSCVAMLEAMARAAGYRTAVYSSPHLLRYNERIRLGGQEIGDEPLCEAFARVEAARGATALTYFEFGTLAAMDLFVRAEPELMILEVGLGGRLDAVNLWDADVAIVTSIGLDHTAWLGTSLDQIAVEKAGIFRAHRPAVIAQADAPASLREQAERIGSRPVQLGREMRVERSDAGWIWVGPDGERLALPEPAMRGTVQYANAAAAIAAMRLLRESVPAPIAALRIGLQQARLPGRFQVVPGPVTWILDVAHNGEAAQALAANLRTFTKPGRCRAVLAMLEDKSPAKFIEPLTPLVAEWFLAASDDARAMPCERLDAAVAEQGGIAVSRHCATLDMALREVTAASSPGDVVLVTGSFVTVAAGLRWIESTSR
ncbi:bifunctional tetrahydrofolate synthase/dihydrofolate synthase [Thiocapsa imhoffii]|uniref:Dihydrofolate synthase/folylpolyglutamate synthase n=1 Tax=Thiocapsa imhoffii TaxID=382777 RepID=A0A9X0WIH5_9GAMM|nr:bifunctional tetrahydrofolate synthase/dihydrofolate synthase [Thiocapsa imhoffii]MBK1645376.1 bifunctional tetrahydrofolate synthase/dihydrofolate synthase [Thiocapsa imhoffii]